MGSSMKRNSDPTSGNSSADELCESLTRDWVHGEHVDARCVAVSDSVLADGLTLRSFDFSDGRFDGGFCARNAVFRGMAWLRRARIAGVCDLSGSGFRNDLRLDGLNCGALKLTGCRFEGVLSLDGASVQSLDLSDSLCLANLSLGSTRIAGALTLDRVTAMGGIWSEGIAYGALAATDLVVDGRRPTFGF